MYSRFQKKINIGFGAKKGTSSKDKYRDNSNIGSNEESDEDEDGRLQDNSDGSQLEMTDIAKGGTQARKKGIATDDE